MFIVNNNELLDHLKRLYEINPNRRIDVTLLLNKENTQELKESHEEVQNYKSEIEMLKLNSKQYKKEIQELEMECKKKDECCQKLKEDKENLIKELKKYTNEI